MPNRNSHSFLFAFIEKQMPKTALVLLATTLALPLWVVIFSLSEPDWATWSHLADTVLMNYVLNSLGLMLLVSIGVFIIGVGTAWLTSMTEFGGRRWFEWLLLLPLAMPAYIIAYTYTGLLSFEGPVQGALRDWMGWGYGDYWFPEIRNLPGAASMLILVLYPYTYLLARAAFMEQSICVLEVSRSLGASPWASFRRVALPLARPAIITGVSLALMETLADYGTVQYFGVDTFTTGLFRTWFGIGSAQAAAQLAALLLVFVFTLVMLERWSRKRARYHHTSSKYSSLPRYPLRGKAAWGAWLACALPVLLGFLLPAAQLAWWTYSTADTVMDASFWKLALNSISVALAAAFIALMLALLLAYSKRLQPTQSIRFSVQLSSMGYAIPGAVIAIGVMLPFSWLDHRISDVWEHWFGQPTGLIFSGTLIALLFAYTVRFLSVSVQAVDAGLGKIKPSMDNAGRSLGLSALGVLTKIHIPLMRGTVLTALLLVFVDVLKELPATLILRPFNFNTLSVRAFEMAADERLADAGAPALMIVLAGLIPVVLLSRSIRGARAGSVDTPS